MSKETKENEKVNDSEGKEQLQSLTDQQKKTIWEWVKYLSTELFKAIAKKLFGLQ
jgi:hypothetical protein